MDRIWQWAWDRYGARYSWAVFAISYFAILPTWLFSSFVVVAFEESDRYAEAAAVTVVAVLVLAYVVTLPGLGGIRLVERWAAGHEVDRARALEATYAFARAAVVRVVAGGAVWAALLVTGVGAIAGASAARPIRVPGRGPRSCHWADHYAWLRGSKYAAGKDRPRR
jgi:adenylate cyclase